MSTSLDAAKSKVQWGEKHFSDFKDILLGRSTGIDTRPTTVVHYDLQPKTSSFPAHVLEPSLECRLAFGDAIHQLRSSLDHIAYQMVKAVTTDPDVLRKVDFPIFVREDRFNESRTVKILERYLRLDQSAEILGTQPYKRNPTSPESEPLWILSELDNIDKHRTILVFDPRLMTKRKMSDGSIQVFKQPLVAGIQELRHSLPIPSSPDDVEVEETSLTVVLAETGLAWDNRIIFGVWRELIENVKDVIGDFESKGLV